MNAVRELGVPEEKATAFFYMVPLERWNVERRDTSEVKGPVELMEHPIVRARKNRWNVVGNAVPSIEHFSFTGT